MDDKCFYCGDTGYIHTNDDIPDQMCPYCEIGQAVIKGYNYARELGVQACDTLEAAKNKRIKELETALESIWPFVEEDFPKGTGDNHGTCATDSYVLAARQIEQALKG